MNYRHAFHAGNFADCFKHALLVALLDTLCRKPSPFVVIDTHAGAGWYALDAEPSRRTAEADGGIRRLPHAAALVLARYLQLVNEIGLYPGSPALIRAALREGDRLVCCELHPEDAASLRRGFRGDPRVETHERSGWEALGALLPPKEKRGLVFIDPPFEANNEFHLLTEGLRRGHDRFRHGMFAAWYPIKQMAAVREFHASMIKSGIRDIIAVELYLRATTNPGQLNGCGLMVINPPYQFPDHARLLAEAVLAGVGNGEAGAGTDVLRLVNE